MPHHAADRAVLQGGRGASSARPTSRSSRPTTSSKELREEKLLTPDPFDEPIEYVYFDLWHYFGRTAKHGAFMGGADFVQWHGFYEMNVKLIELKKQAEELRAASQARQPRPRARDEAVASETRTRPVAWWADPLA